MKAYSVIPDLNNQAKEILKNSNITLTINEGGDHTKYRGNHSLARNL